MKFFASNMLAAFGVSLFVSAHSVAAEPSNACAADSGISYVCGLMNAEDLLSVGDSGFILTSGMTSEGVNGHVYLIDPDDNSWHDLVSALNFSQDFDSVPIQAVQVYSMSPIFQLTALLCAKPAPTCLICTSQAMADVRPSKFLT